VRSHRMRAEADVLKLFSGNPHRITVSFPLNADQTRAMFSSSG
jgi:hypothetical protein